MKIPGIKTARQASRWLRGRLFGGALILGYHRIERVTYDPYGICVTPTHFAEHLEILSQYANPISLPELVQRLEQGTLPPHSVAVTFDDGYADNYYQAKSLLEKFQIPATIFISTDYLGKEFWWDELATLIMMPPALPDSLRLTIRDERFEWQSPNAKGTVDSRQDSASRRELINSLYLLLLPLDVEERMDVMRLVEGWTGIQLVGYPSPRALTPAELHKLSEGHLIEIGAHTKSHPFLSRIPVERQKEEIQSSKAELEELVNKPVSGFAYPNGDCTAGLQNIVRETGYLYACSSHRDLAWHNRQRYALPRFWPKDWDRKRFARELRVWLGLKINSSV